ncbi:hypothetical protein [Actinomadura opuntiae]|uniref:hypothetical protein n=1 Tax=Actinomadura sp. OS1-43 TaxID=604315 RepID=UPI00255B1E66|nr:hypothetical protein [Actinomadura sp. OS1-43]MDL4812820.1 hypothetical protein [Actinomadura sp. OS1-43]
MSEQPLQGNVVPPSHIRLAPGTADAGAVPPGDAPEQPAGTDVQDPERDAREVQAMAEGVTLADRVECMGGWYRIKDKVGLMPLMRFAHVSKKVDEDDLEALVCIYDMLRACIHPKDWDRFVADMTEKDAEAEELMPVVARTMEILSARPTRQPSASSDGRPATSPTSTRTSLPAPPPGREMPDWVNDTIPVADIASARSA